MKKLKTPMRLQKSKSPPRKLKSPTRASLRKPKSPPPRPNKPPARTSKPSSPRPRTNTSLIQPSQLQMLPPEVFCKIWSNLKYVPATFIKSSLTISKDVAEKIYYCTEKILLDTIDINLDKFKVLKSVKIDYKLNNTNDVKCLSKILNKLCLRKIQIIFTNQWKSIDYNHEKFIYLVQYMKRHNLHHDNIDINFFHRGEYRSKKMHSNREQTSLPYIQQGQKTIVQNLVKVLTTQQLKNMGNAIAVSILYDYNWRRVKCLLDTLFKNVTPKQRHGIALSMSSSWFDYTSLSTKTDRGNNIGFRYAFPREYSILTQIPKYLLTQVTDSRYVTDKIKLDLAIVLPRH